MKPLGDVQEVTFEMDRRRVYSMDAPEVEVLTWDGSWHRRVARVLFAIDRVTLDR